MYEIFRLSYDVNRLNLGWDIPLFREFKRFSCSEMKLCFCPYSNNNYL